MNNLENNISSLSDREIIDEVLKLNKKQICHIRRSSLIKSMTSINKSRLLMEEFSERKESRPELDFIGSSIDKMASYLEEELDLDELLDLREELYLYKTILDGYLVELSYIGETVDEEGLRILSDNGQYDGFQPKQLDELIAMIHYSLESSKDNYNKYSFILAELIKVLPMRLVKGNYYDILRDSISRNLRGYNQSMVDMVLDNYKKQFDSSIRDGYGLKFDHYFMAIEGLKREDISAMDLDELSKLVEKIMNLTADLSNIRDFVLGLGLISNLILVEEKSRDYEIDSEKLLEDWKEVKDSDRNAYNEKMSKELLDMEQKLAKELSYYEDLSKELASRNNVESEELDGELLKTRDILAYYNDIGFSDLKYLELVDFAIADERYIENSVESLVEYMERSSKFHSNLERKIRMRKVLSLVDLPFANIGDFTDYIRYSLDPRILDKRIISFKINQIIYFLNEINSK